MKSKKKHYWYFGSIGILGLLLLAMLMPVVPSDATAETLSATLSTKTTAYLYSTISLATSGVVEINLTPKANGSLATGTAEVRVATNNTTGYSIFLATVDRSNKLNQIDNKLQYDDERENYAINALETETTIREYLDSSSNLNTWGYALTTGASDNETVYRGLVNATGDNIYTTKSTSSHDSYNLNVAVAADTSLPAGGYRNGLVVTAVANPVQVSGFNKIMYMQEMTPAVCNEVEVGEASELVDKRDNTIYQVAKLADGHCWMTQNLALDLVEGTTLTEADTDLANTETKTWMVSASTERDIPLPNTNDNTTARSWNLGKIVLTNPTAGVLCPAQDPAVSGVPGQSYPDNGNRNSAFTGQSIADNCPEYYKDVSNGWMANADRDLYSKVSSTNGTNYDPHYLIGNYYQYGAATAGTGIGLTGTNAINAVGEGLTNASGSICPKGWQLPKAGRNNGDTEVFGVGPGESYPVDGSFYGLMSKYGYNTGWVVTGSDGGYMPINIGTKQVDYEPMYFVRGGSINPSFGSLYTAGYESRYWSATAYLWKDTSYFLRLAGANVFPSGFYNRNYGLNIRCLAR